MYKTKKIIVIIERKESEPGPMPHWMMFLLYLAWLRAVHPQPHISVTVLATLIISVALVLTVVALVAAGAPEMVAETLKNWPIAP